MLVQAEVNVVHSRTGPRAGREDRQAAYGALPPLRWPGTGIGVSAASAQAATFSVDNGGDSGPVTPADCTDAIAGNCSFRGKPLRSANGNADPATVDHIVFSSSVTGAIALSQGQIQVAERVSIDGPGADALAVDGGGASRILYFYNVGGRSYLSGLELE